MTRPIILDGDNLARDLRAGLATEVATLRAGGLEPRLVTILVGDNAASESYVARKHADCRELGIASREIRLPETVTADELARQIDHLNQDRSVHGFLVQLPLPAHLDANAFIDRVDPAKDIDGLHAQNLGRLMRGDPFLLPCTPAGVLALLQHHEVPLAGRRVVIVGRGTLVGKPLALLLAMQGIDATVTLAHSRTPDLAAITAEADVVISATGVIDLVRADMIRPGAAVVGVGISSDSSGAMVSDIAEDVQDRAGWVTPRHGSVGPLTRAMLLRNLLKLARGSQSIGRDGSAR